MISLVSMIVRTPVPCEMDSLASSILVEPANTSELEG